MVRFENCRPSVAKKSLLKNSISDVRPLKGHLISNDLRYR